MWFFCWKGVTSKWKKTLYCVFFIFFVQNVIMIKCWVCGEYKCPPEPASRPDWPRGDLSQFEFYPHKLLPRTALSTHSFILIFNPLKMLESLKYKQQISQLAIFCEFQSLKPQRCDPPRPSPMWPALLLATLSICHSAFAEHQQPPP